MRFIGRQLKTLAPILLLAPFSMIGCGGGSGGGGGTPGAAITASPDRYDFGLVTEGNLDDVTPRQFVIRNTGTTSYNVSSIRLAGTDPADFFLNEQGGDDPCNALALSLSPGDSCTVAVSFTPRSFAAFSAALIVQTNDPNASSIARALSGTYAEIQSINVAINQVSACPRDQATVFVSVTDEGGFPVRGLATADFALAEDAGGGFGDPESPFDARTVEGAGLGLSLSLVMDYSGSIVDVPADQQNMETAAKKIVNSMTAGDEAEVVKYAERVEITQPFTDDTALLLEAIDRQPDVGRNTALYDAVGEAVDRIRVRLLNPRKVVIALTDGVNNAGDTELQDAINAAIGEDVPVFTIGFGDVNAEDLGKLAADTGGVFYQPPASDNLEDTYQQIANLLFKDQYVLTYGSGLPADGGKLKVSVEFEKLTGRPPS
jgi:VWFA-related protein